MRLLPAPAGSGIVFRRTDLDNFEIPATGRNVAKVSYATSLMRQGVLISTTEHLLSALSAWASTTSSSSSTISNCPSSTAALCPMSKPSARWDLKIQRRRREYLRILKTVEVREGRQVHRRLSRRRLQHLLRHRLPAPHRHVRASPSISLPAPTAPRSPLPAPSAFSEDEEMLRNMGLIRGVSETSAIILTRNGVLNGPLRFDDEFVRHKVLDLIGDLALAGHRILGRVVAERAGHAMHTALVSRSSERPLRMGTRHPRPGQSKLKDRLKEKFLHRAAALVDRSKQTPGTAASQ